MTLIIVSGNELALAAEDALTHRGFETSPGYCMRWVREVVQEVYGDVFNAFWAATAAESLKLWQADNKYIRPAGAAISRGDLLYKAPQLSGIAGHVGIMGIHGQVCENSSYHWDAGADRPDARGSRSLTAFGPFTAIVRLSVYNKG